MASSSSRHKARGTDHQGLAGLPNTWSIERAPASSGPYLGINAIREPFTVVILVQKTSPLLRPSTSASNLPSDPLSFPSLS